MQWGRSRTSGRVKNEAAAVRDAATRLLARREHATAELRRKLVERGFETPLIDTTLVALRRERLLSDERYAESYARSRAQKGFGPVRIAGELRERGLDEELIAQNVDFAAAEWQDAVRRVADKRFGAMPAGDINERARRGRFLQYRGFTHAQIQQYLQADSDLPP